MAAAERFTRREVQRILDVTEKQLDYWERLRIVTPRKGKGEKSYEFRDLISLRTAKQLIEQGDIIPVIDRAYPLAETAQAIRYFEEGRTRGKIVITRDHDTYKPAWSDSYTPPRGGETSR